DNAHTGDVVLERDVPEPTFAARWGAQHQRRAAIQIRFAVRALKIGIEDALFEFWIAYAPAKPVRQHCTLAGRVDDYPGVKTLERAILHPHFDANCLVAFKKYLLDGCTLVHRSALISSVFDEQLIEFGAGHLPGDGTFMVHRLEEIKRAR